jgi:hypothetical protein
VPISRSASMGQKSRLPTRIAVRILDNKPLHHNRIAMANFPLILNFDLWSVPHKMTLKDAAGTTYMQAARSLTLKQQIEVTTYENHQQQVYKVEAERLLSMRPVYDIWHPQGQTIGTIQPSNRWWDPQYNIYDGKTLIFQVQAERNPRWFTILLLIALMAIGLAGFASRDPTLHTLGVFPFLIAIIGMNAVATGHILNPIYTVKRPDGRRVMQFAKIPEFKLRHSRFSIKSIEQVSETEEHSALFAIMLMILGERSRN